MFIELIDLLRCPRPHEESWLVAAIYEKADRDIVRGVLGCPVCSAAYPIADGVAIFDDAPRSDERDARGAYDESDDDAAMRCAAMLDLFDPGGAVVLGGAWARAARALLDITPVSVLLVDPPRSMRMGNGISAIRIGDRLPVAAASLRGIALDERTAAPAIIASAVRALRPRGRLVAPVSAAIPPGAVARARDDRHWVAEVVAATTAPIPLTRQRSGDSP